MLIRPPLRPQALNRHFAGDVAPCVCPPDVAPERFERARLGAQRFALLGRDRHVEGLGSGRTVQLP